ncbi:MAG: hypothetical protein MUC81_01415 [Bacteroidia bacterium]|jgi:hypothetical protein|nr:hypothetical protein [Bacteroidia bacterium]
MNKKIISAFAFACLTMFQLSLFAQDNNEAKTLLGSGNLISTKDLGFFVAPSYGITQMDGSTASLFNLRGGINLKDKFCFGAYFNTSLNQIRPQSETIQNIYMDYWTVGGFAEYTLFSKKIAHLTFPLYVGYGEVQMDNENGDAGLGEANFFQIEPSALLEVNLHKYVRFNIGAGYRFVGQMNYRNFNQSDISGLTGYVGLKFGLFR